MTHKERLAIPPLTHYSPRGESRVDIVTRLLNPPPPLTDRLLGWLTRVRFRAKTGGSARRRFAGSSA
jgi:hypothetical protein